jgi:two-component system chemotaxis response regulator CheY
MSDRALVVDDSGVMRKVIVRSLNAVGFTDIVEAADGAEAFRMLQETTVSLVLTDWNMPNKSGIELTRDIRATGSTVPIFMITTEGERGRVVEAVQSGVNDYLLKPFTSETVREKLEKYAPAAC